MFSTSELVNHINDAIKTGTVDIPNDKKVAFITSVQVDKNGQVEAQAVFAMRMGKEWHVAAVTDWSHEAGMTEGIHLTWSK